MAAQETKKQRRAQARSERRNRSEREAKQRRWERIRRAGVAGLSLIVAAGFIWQAYFTGPASLDDAILVQSDEADAAHQQAGCQVLAERDPLPDSSHFEATDQPPGDLIYPDIRPTHSGPHTSQTLPPITGGTSSQIDEMVVTHNLEHGSVVVWYDPDQIDQGTADEMGQWSRLLNDNGFVGQAGAAIFVSPYEEPGISSGQAIAFRAWGTAVDCDEWDETVANAFVADNYGTRGIAPEATAFAPYPSGVLEVTEEDPSAMAPEHR